MYWYDYSQHLDDNKKALGYIKTLKRGSEHEAHVATALIPLQECKGAQDVEPWTSPMTRMVREWKDTVVHLFERCCKSGHFTMNLYLHDPLYDVSIISLHTSFRYFAYKHLNVVFKSTYHRSLALRATWMRYTTSILNSIIVGLNTGGRPGAITFQLLVKEKCMKLRKKWHFAVPVIGWKLNWTSC